MLSRLLARFLPPAPGPLEPAETLAVLHLGPAEERHEVPALFCFVPDDLSGRRLVVRVDPEDWVYAHGAAADELVRVGVVERGAEAIFVVGHDRRTVRDLRAAFARRGLDPRRVVRRNAAELLVRV